MMLISFAKSSAKLRLAVTNFEPSERTERTSPPADGAKRETMASFQPCTRGTKRRAGESKVFTLGNGNASKQRRKDHADGWSIMSVPLTEMKGGHKRSRDPPLHLNKGSL